MLTVEFYSNSTCCRSVKLMSPGSYLSKRIMNINPEDGQFKVLNTYSLRRSLRRRQSNLKVMRKWVWLSHFLTDRYSWRTLDESLRGYLKVDG